jgi:iron(III) transport system permease protein
MRQAQTTEGLRLRLATLGEAAVTHGTLLLVLLMIMLPIVYLFYGSMQSGSPFDPTSTWDLESWRRVYLTPEFVRPLLNTVALPLVVALASVLIGVIMAWIVARTNAPWRRRLAPLLVLPLLISNLVTTLAWIALAAPNAGFINAALKLAFDVGLVFDIYSFSGMVFVLTLHFASFAFVPCYAALQSIDGSLEEASYMLGSTPLRTAVHMTAPLIWPTLAATFLIVFIFVAENFAVPTILGGTIHFDTIASEVYKTIEQQPSNPPLAAAIGSLLLWIGLAGTLWQRSISRNAGRYVTVAGKGARHIIADLGRWRFLATGVLVLYLLLAVVLPYLALIFGSFLTFLTPRIKLSMLTTENYERLLAGDLVQTTGTRCSSALSERREHQRISNPPGAALRGDQAWLAPVLSSPTKGRNGPHHVIGVL